MKRTNIGGQAVIEGVMMRGKKMYAMAVRNPEGGITIEKKNWAVWAEKGCSVCLFSAVWRLLWIHW